MLITLKEIVLKTKLKPRLIYQLVNENKVRFYKLGAGKRIYFNESEFNEDLEKMKIEIKTE